MASTADAKEGDQEAIQIIVSNDWTSLYETIKPKGFHNPGILCYRNVVLQTLLHTPFVLNWIQEVHGYGHECDMQTPSLLCALHHLSIFYWFSTRSNTDSHDTCMDMVWDRFLAVSWGNIDLGEQQDARECMEAFLKQLSWDTDVKRYWEFQHYIQTKLKKHLVCNSCGAKSTLPPDQQFFLVASFPEAVGKPPSYEVAHAIAHNLRETMLIWACNKCEVSTEHSLHERIDLLPETLFVQVNRLGYKAKLIGGLNIQDELVIPDDLRDPDAADKEEACYELRSVIFHKGVSTNSGHYYCAVKLPNGKWALINDSNVSDESTLDSILGTRNHRNAYILAYRRLPSKEAPARSVTITAKERHTSPMLPLPSNRRTLSASTSGPNAQGTSQFQSLANDHENSGIILEEVIKLREGFELKLNQHFEFPPGVNHLIELKPRAKKQHVKLHLKVTSAATGETLEGEVDVALVPKKERVAPAKPRITIIKNKKSHSVVSKKRVKKKSIAKKQSITTISI